MTKSPLALFLFTVAAVLLLRAEASPQINWSSVIGAVDHFAPMAVGESGYRCFGGSIPFPKTKCRGYIQCRRLQQMCKRQCEEDARCRAWTTAKVSCWRAGGVGWHCDRGHHPKYHAGIVRP